MSFAEFVGVPDLCSATIPPTMVSTMVTMGEAMFSDARKNKPFLPMPALTMRERIAQSHENIQRDLADAPAEFEEAFGIETSHEKFDPKSEKVVSRGRFKSGTEIRNAEMSGTREYMAKMSRKICNAVESEKRESWLDSQAAVVPEHQQGHNEPFAIEFVDIDPVKIDENYRAFALMMEEKAPGFLRAIA